MSESDTQLWGGVQIAEEEDGTVSNRALTVKSTTEGKSAKPASVRSHLVSVSISEIQTRKNEILRHCFSHEELLAISSKPLQTIAGRLAAKQAVCGLIATVFDDASISERDIALESRENGAPRVRTVTCGMPAVKACIENEVFISISHSKQMAVGLAVIQKP